MKTCHPDPRVAEIAERFPSQVVLASAGDPACLPIGHVVVASGYDPGAMPQHHLEKCRTAMMAGLAVLIAAPVDEVRDHGKEQVMAWCFDEGGRA